MRRAVADGVAPEQLDEERIARYLYAPVMRDPDLLIRTSGEKRLSNFLLWESAYSELYFSEVLWPDFDEAELALAVQDYAARDRRFGRADEAERGRCLGPACWSPPSGSRWGWPSSSSVAYVPGRRAPADAGGPPRVLHVDAAVPTQPARRVSGRNRHRGWRVLLGPRRLRGRTLPATRAALRLGHGWAHGPPSGGPHGGDQRWASSGWRGRSPISCCSAASTTAWRCHHRRRLQLGERHLRLLRRAGVRPAPDGAAHLAEEDGRRGRGRADRVGPVRPRGQDLLAVAAGRDAAMLGLVVGVTGQWGDLFESAVKRDLRSRTRASSSAGTAASSTASIRCCSPAIACYWTVASLLPGAGREGAADEAGHRPWGRRGPSGVQALDVIARDPELCVVGSLLRPEGRRAPRAGDGARRQRPGHRRRARGASTLALYPSCAVRRGRTRPPVWCERSSATWCSNAIVGFAGLESTLAALEGGRPLALANKESLVSGGRLVTGLAAAPGVRILPVDSEHSALFQLLAGGRRRQRWPRSCSRPPDGPFRGRAAAELGDVAPQDALAHPTWSMGAKITIDSATLMNKGLEVIEAHHLFALPYDRIEVVVHPQSLVHALVRLVDGALLAHLGVPDMRVPIAFALHYPRAGGRCPRAARSRRGGRVSTSRPPTRSRSAAMRSGPRGGAGRGQVHLRAERGQRGGGARLP